MNQPAPERALVLVTMDRETSSVVFTRSDGKEARFPLHRPPFETSSALARIHYAPGGQGILAVTLAGDEVLFELPQQDGVDQLAERQVVYLDQNHWSTCANALRDPDRVPAEADRLAALRLVGWAKERRIVLPASAGHHFETTKWGDAERRYRLGLTVAQASRGWQMRDPVQVRHDELHDMFRRMFGGGTGLRCAPVFTLGANALYGQWRGWQPYEAAADLSAADAFLTEALTSASVSIDVLLDFERVEAPLDTGWAQANQSFSDWLDEQDRDSQQKRKAIDAFLLSDLSTDITQEAAASGTSVDQLREWLLGGAPDAVARLPSAGVFRALVHERHLNKGTVWRTNDVTDMVYLSCAAAYASVVVCEGHMSAMLSQALRWLGRPHNVYGRLRDAVPAVEVALAMAR